MTALGERRAELLSLEFSVHSFPGYYIAVEGTGATGKETISLTLQDRIRHMFPEVPSDLVVVTREPGGSPKAERMRAALKVSKYWPVKAQIDGFNQARDDSLNVAVAPVLEQGGVVISDRNFAATCAYQGAAGGYGVEQVLARSKPVIGRFIPNCFVCIERDLTVALEQARQRDLTGEHDSFDQAGLRFNLAVQGGYRRLRELLRCVTGFGLTIKTGN
ncbi:MAG: hypothetical protein AAB599_02210 [Patescibacteria group bacterium]